LDREKELLLGGAETRELPRLPVRVERPRDAFNPNVLNLRWPRGVASYRTPSQQTVCLRRHPIELKTRNATPSELGLDHATPGATSLRRSSRRLFRKIRPVCPKRSFSFVVSLKSTKKT